jgi:rhodanese-related sulfurtransferase
MNTFLRDFLVSTKDDWNYITPVDFYENFFMKKKEYFLVDLRDEDSFKKMHIKGAKNIFWLSVLDDKI